MSADTFYLHRAVTPSGRRIIYFQALGDAAEKWLRDRAKNVPTPGHSIPVSCEPLPDLEFNRLREMNYARWSQLLETGDCYATVLAYVLEKMGFTVAMTKPVLTAPEDTPRVRYRPDGREDQRFFLVERDGSTPPTV